MYLHCTYQGSEKQSNLHKETANGGASSLTLPLIYLANRKKTLDLLKESQVPSPTYQERVLQRFCTVSVVPTFVKLTVGIIVT